MTRKKLNIAILSHSDTLGGAAVASFRLMEQLRSEGHHVTMIVKQRHSDDPDVILAGTWLSRTRAFLRERIEIFVRNGFTRRDLFKVSTGSFGLPVWKHQQVRDADAVILGWVSQGLLSLDGLDHILSLPGKRVYTVMHDLWWMTGICHHPYGCRRFRESCGDCKFLHSSGSPCDLSRKVWLKKRELYRRHGNSMRFIAVSGWVKRLASESSLLGDFPVGVVHNPMDPGRFEIETDLRTPFLEGHEGKRVIALGAARLDDPVKGIGYAIDALNMVAERRSDIAASTVAVFFGAKRNRSLFDNLRFPHVDAGMLTDKGEIARLLASTDVILSSSLYETYGGTLIEGIASGATAVTFGEGGQRDIVIEGVNGFVAEPSPSGSGDTADGRAAEALAASIEKAIDRIPESEEARRKLRRANRESILGLCSEPFPL